MEIKVPNDVFTIVHEFKAEDWAPGLWTGMEGLTYVVTSVDLENRVITLKVKE